MRRCDRTENTLQLQNQEASSKMESRADVLYQRMSESPALTLFTQDQLQQLVNETDLVKILGMTQNLIDRRMMKLVKKNDELHFQIISVSETKKLTSMNEDEQMVYSYIEASAREGIWTKTLKAKTNMHQHIVTRCLKLLESQRYIKLIKSVQHPTRKIYMLYNLQPSIDVTGGPWFTDSELDTEFIDSLLTVVWRFIALKTFPTAFLDPAPNANILLSVYPASFTGFASLESVMDFITSHKITNIELGIHDVRSLCKVLIYDERIEAIAGDIEVYKATWQSVLEAGFGRQYREASTLNALQADFITNMEKTKQYSVFEHYSVINEQLNPLDIVYGDSWANQ